MGVDVQPGSSVEAANGVRDREQSFRHGHRRHAGFQELPVSTSWLPCRDAWLALHVLREQDYKSQNKLTGLGDRPGP